MIIAMLSLLAVLIHIGYRIINGKPLFNITQFMITDITILVLVILPYFFDPTMVMGQDLVLGLAVFCSIILLYFGLYGFPFSIIGREQFNKKNLFKKNQNKSFWSLRAFLIVWFFIIVSACLRVNRVLRIGKDRSLSAFYLNEGILSGTYFFDYLISYFSGFFWIYLSYLVKQKRRVRFFIIWFAAAIPMLLSSGGRYNTLTFFIVPVLYWLNGKKREIIIPFLVPLMLMLLYILNIWRHQSLYGFIDSLSLVSFRSAFNSFSRDLSPIRSFDLLGKMNQQKILKYDYFYQILLTFLVFIPRFLWPGKPIIAFESRYTEFLFGGVGLGNPIMTFTVFGEGIAMCGIAGMLLYAYLFGLLYWFVLEKWLKKVPYASFLSIFIIIHIPNWFRSSMSSALFFHLILFIFTTLILKTVIRRFSIWDLRNKFA